VPLPFRQVPPGATFAGVTATPPTTPKRRAVLWVNTTYFAEGLPYMVVRILSSVFFTQLGVKERYLGYLHFLVIPWNF